MVHALIGGTAAMRAAGKALLPQWPQEDDDSYKTRLSVATLYPVFRRTVEVNAARPFSRPATVTAKGIPEEWLCDVDLQGSNINAFANSMLYEGLAYGMGGILVDYPPVANIKTKEQEKAVGARPYFVKYSGTHILGWRIERSKLTQLRLLENVEIEDGQWSTEIIEQVRVLEPGKWQTYRLNEKSKEWDLFDEGPTTLDCIPWVFVYGLKIAFGHGHTPLKDLAYLNVEHYQSSSDQQTILHVARVPILFGKGFGDSQITIGASHAVMADDKDADLSYVEHQGTSIESGRQSLLDLEERMRATGAELISQKPVQTTATQVNSEGESAKSLLQQIVENLEESICQAICFMGQWAKKPVEPTVEFFKSFTSLPPHDKDMISNAKKAGVISGQTMFEELQRRDVISLDRNWNDEKTRLQSERDTVSGPQSDDIRTDDLLNE